MIDNPTQVERLIARLKTQLPLITRMTPELMATLTTRNQAAPLDPSCEVVSINYAGDEGGILCHLESGGIGAHHIKILGNGCGTRKSEKIDARAEIAGEFIAQGQSRATRP